MKRQHYIDNLRWICIVILIPFHTAMAWNNWEGNYIWLGENKILSSIVITISPFYMPLLFVLAGMSMNYALRKRSYKQFLGERNKKILIPMLSGLATVVALMTFLADKFHNGYTGSFFQHFSVFFGGIGDFSGYDGQFTPAHLWFMLFLFLGTLLLLLIVMLQRKFFPNITFKNLKLWQVFLLVVFPILMTYILNFGGKSIGECFALVALGYYVFSEEEILEKLKKYFLLFLCITAVACAYDTYLFVWQNQGETLCCQIFHEIAEWCGILGFIGFGKRFLEIDNKLTRFMTVRSFSIYIFHFGWIVIIQYYLHSYITNTVLLYLVTIVGTSIFTLQTIEIIKRIPGLRFLFGMKKVNKIK